MKTINFNFAKRAFVILSTLFLFVTASAGGNEGVLNDDGNTQANEAVNKTEVQVYELPADSIHRGQFPIKYKSRIIKLDRRIKGTLLRLNSNHLNGNRHPIDHISRTDNLTNKPLVHKVVKDPVPKPGGPHAHSDPWILPRPVDR